LTEAEASGEALPGLWIRPSPRSPRSTRVLSPCLSMVIGRQDGQSATINRVLPGMPGLRALVKMRNKRWYRLEPLLSKRLSGKKEQAVSLAVPLAPTGGK
jgi:hypothetical protein